VGYLLITNQYGWVDRVEHSSLESLVHDLVTCSLCNCEIVEILQNGVPVTCTKKRVLLSIARQMTMRKYKRRFYAEQRKHQKLPIRVKKRPKIAQK